MKKNDFVRNEEELYRSVRGKLEEYSYGPKGNLQISSEAFRDRDRKPSVDRAELRKFNPALSKLSDTDGVVSLMTADVRAIGIVKTKIQNEDAVVHAVDVVYDPTPENPAHSQIIRVVLNNFCPIIFHIRSVLCPCFSKCPTYFLNFIGVVRSLVP